MKAYTTIFHKGHQYDPTLSHLFRAFEIVNNVDNCDVVIMPITYQDNYVFDYDEMEAVQRSGKKIVVVDFVEYGWDVKNPDHIFGINTWSWKEKFRNPDYDKLDEFIYKNSGNVAVYFKRELVTNSRLTYPFKVLPAEYPGFTYPTDNTPDSFEDFNNRPIDILMCWGLSNPSRQILHGEIIKQSALKGQHLVSNIDHVEICYKRGDKRMVAMLHVPDFARVPMDKLIAIQSMAKVSISLSGAGTKCFRSAESPYNSVMAIQENNLKWSYPWIHGENSIELPNKIDSVLISESMAYHKIMHYLENPEKLYNMYLKGLENWKNYEVNKYSEYILKAVKESL